jgi:putative ABC transport system substrate-binding protein
MRRRTFIAALGSAAAWPLAARAQQPTKPVIGLLASVSLVDQDITAFHQGLSEIGYVEGHDVIVEYRHADGSYDRLAHLAAELVSLPVNVVVAVPSSPAVLAARKITSTIPIVFTIGADPVHLGLVASYNRPEGNLTGVVFNSDELTPKRIELLDEILPKSAPVGVLVNSSNPLVDEAIRLAQQGARAVNRELIVAAASTKAEIEDAFDLISQQHAGGLVVWQESYFAQERSLIVSLASRHALPAIYGPSLFPEIGGLMSYGPDRENIYRNVGRYTGRILKGEKPRDLPVLQPTKFAFVINLKTAKALGLVIPPSLLARADEVIE